MQKYLVGSLLVFSAFAVRMLFGQRNQAEAELNAIAWLLREGRKPFQMPKVQPYGDLTELNTDGTILRTVGKDLLVNVAGDAGKRAMIVKPARKFGIKGLTLIRAPT